jgi:hypothetical protein
MKSLEQFVHDVDLELQPLNSFGHRVTLSDRAVGVEWKVDARRFILEPNAGTDWLLLSLAGGPQIPLTRDERGVSEAVRFIKSWMLGRAH